MKASYLSLAFLVLLALSAPASAAPGGHYIPKVGDGFHYYEEVTVTNGVGDYSGYTEATFINGSEGVTAVAGNGTESADFANTWTYSNSSGGSLHGGAQGAFTFSAETFLYVQGTDNQTGYVNPAVWFYINNSLPAGQQVELLNTPSTIESTNWTYQFPTDSSRYVRTIYTEGSGTYTRDDSYGEFSASYTWRSYFDPATGYIVGYAYTEQDSNTSGDGFTYTDLLSVTTTTYALTAASAPGQSSASSSGTSNDLVIALVVIVVIVVIVVLAALALRSRRRSSLPRHSAGGRVEYGTMPMPPPPPVPPGMAPPPIRLTGAQQPAVQQVVLRETVKVNCRYCGTLIDSTATVCPNCGAPRT